MWRLCAWNCCILSRNGLKAGAGTLSQAREVVWVQEEPENMGAWSYMAPRLPALLEPGWTLQHISRPARSSPATGFSDLFQFEQESIIQQALHTSVKVRSA